MKHITILLAVLIASLCNIYSQDGVGNSMSLDYNSLSSKLEKSNKNLENPKKNVDPKFWIERAKLFQDIYDVNIESLRRGMGAPELMLYANYKEPKEKKQTQGMDEYVYDKVAIYLKDGKVESWKDLKPIVQQPLEESLNAYKKAIELDVEKKQDKKIGEGLKSLKNLYLKRGLNCYASKDTMCLFTSFKTMVDIGEMKQVNVTDTAIIYNTGFTATLVGLHDEAIKYLSKVITLKYPEPSIYIYLEKAYLGKKDTVNALKALNDGMALYPSDLNIIIELLNFYITTNDINSALTYIAKAKQSDPKNRSFYYVEGYLYSKTADNMDEKLNKIEAVKKDEIAKLNEDKKAEFKKTGNNIQKYKPIDDKYKKLITDVEAKYKAQEDSLVGVSKSYQEKATDQYKKALEIDPNYFDAAFGLGLMYFANGLRVSEQADKENDDAKYQVLKDAANEEFKKSVPYMELAYEINQKAGKEASPKRRESCLENLKTLYYRLKMDDQFMRVKKLIDDGQ